MSKLLFTREVANIHKQAKQKVEMPTSAIALIGGLTLAFVAAALILYVMKQPDVGRAVVDLAVAFLAWSSGRASGEKAGLTHR